MAKIAENKGAHTPGPWRVATSAIMVNPHIFGADPVLPVAEVLNSYLPSRRADAAMIAAAPDLAEACRMLVRSWNHGEDESVRLEHCVEAARAALAKAGIS